VTGALDIPVVPVFCESHRFEYQYVAFVSWPDKVRNSIVDPCSESETRSAKEPYKVVVSIAVTECV